MEFNFMLSKVQQSAKEKRVQKLLQNPYLLEWRKKYAVDDTFVYDHSGRFQDYCDSMEKCKHCQGLCFCRQPLHGKYMELRVDGILVQELVNCSYQLQENSLFAHQKKYRLMDMPKQNLLVNISKLDLRNESMEYKHVVMQVLQKLMDEEDTKGLYFWGKPGVGKSYLAAGMCNYYAKKGYGVAFVNVARLIADLKMMFQDPAAMEERIRMIQHVDVLVLDDIGGESVTSWSRDDILLPLLDARMENKKRTIFTSNYSLEELKDKLAMAGSKKQEPMAAQRLLERICALSCEIFVKGCSRRK